MAVTANFIASFDKFTEQVEKSVTSLKTLESGGARVASALNRVGDSFSGRKIIQDANLAVKAVTDIGGATKLTAKEQERVNALVTEALAKYKALGKEAPASMVALADATKKTEQSLTLAQRAGSVFMGTMGQFAAGFGIATLADRGVSALVGLGKEMFDTADQVANLAQKTGASTDAIQRWAYVAEQAGGSTEAFAQASYKLGTNLAGGSSSIKEALKAIGLEYANIRQLAPEDQFDKVTAALGQVQDVTERNRLGTILYGKTFSEIASAVIADYERIRSEAPVVSAAQIKAFDEFGDEAQRIWREVKAAGQEAVGGFMTNLRQAGQAARNVLDLNDEGLRTFMKSGQTPVQFFGGMEMALDSLETFAKSLQASGKAAQAATEPTRNYIKELSSLDAQLLQLMKTHGAEIDAAQKMGVSAEELAKKYPVLEDHLGRYNQVATEAKQQTSAQAKAFEDATKRGEQYREELRRLEMTITGISEAEAKSIGGVNAVDNMAAFAYVNQMRELRQKELERGSPTISPEMARSMQSGADLAITEQAKLKEIITKNVEEIRDLWQDATLYMADATSQAFGDMLTGLRSFKDGALSIWRSLQQTVSGIIAQLVNNYLRGLLAMGQGTAAAFGGGGGGAAAGGGALGSVAGAGLGVAQQALGGGGGTAAGMPGAWGAFGQAAVVGGVAGFSTGYGSRSYTAGALTGAGTGALAGLQFGLQTGNWYVAAGAAGVGAVMGLLGAKLGKNADAKQVEMARLDYYRSQGGLYGAYKVQEAAGVFAGDPKGVEAYHGFNAAKTSEDFTYWGEKLEEAILQRRTGSPTGYPNPSVPMNPPQPKGTVNGVPFYANEVFGVKTPHLAVIGDAREAENVVKDSTLKRLAGGAEVVTAIEQLSAKIDRVFSDLPRANAVALSSALVLAGVKGR